MIPLLQHKTVQWAIEKLTSAESGIKIGTFDTVKSSHTCLVGVETRKLYQLILEERQSLKYLSPYSHSQVEQWRSEYFLSEQYASVVIHHRISNH